MLHVLRKLTLVTILLLILSTTSEQRISKELGHALEALSLLEYLEKNTFDPNVKICGTPIIYAEEALLAAIRGGLLPSDTRVPEVPMQLVSRSSEKSLSDKF